MQFIQIYLYTSIIVEASSDFLMEKWWKSDRGNRNRGLGKSSVGEIFVGIAGRHVKMHS